MSLIFDYVYRFLMFLAEKTGFTYFEINIICYYFIIPFIYVSLIDRINKFHYLKVSFVIFVSVTIFSINDFTAFSETFFRLSQKFLLSFNVIGMNYVVSSVVWCLIIPLLILAVLLWIARQRKKMTANLSPYENK